MNEKELETLKTRFYSREDISQKNKEYVKDFFKGYNCAKSSEGKFYSWLPYVLTQTEDIKQTMNNEDELKEVFNKIHSRLKPSGYKTTLTTVKTFCRELNKGIVPEAFGRVKQLTKQEKKQLLRAENPNYKTLSWEDGLRIAEHTNSMQLKALVLTQLDGGLRPAELEALNYGDVKKDGKFIFLKVNNSKTAEPRDVILFRATPYLNRWLDLHPTKKEKEPLWLMENVSKSSLYRSGVRNLRYNYYAIKQTIRRLSQKAGFNYGTSLYMMRHSAVAIDKTEGLPMELGAEKFGHDINYYVNVYGRMTPEQKIERFRYFHGEESERQRMKPKPLLCKVCETINEPDKELCEKCNSPLTIAAALKYDKSKELQQLREQIANISETLQLLIKENPETLKKALEIKRRGK